MFKIQHVPREKNVCVDIISKLVSAKTGNNNKSLIQETLKTPSITDSASISAIEDNLSWMVPIMQYLLKGVLPHDHVDAKRMAKQAFYYSIVGGQLYRRGLSQPLFKCLSPDRAIHVLEEVHDGSCGHDPRGKALVLKILRSGYYWPTMIKDVVEFIKKCLKCQ